MNPADEERGVLGREEATAIVPAIEAARERSIDVDGPVPADRVFVRARAGRYHGVAVMGGLPVPIVTVGHGTAYDIVGRGLATAAGMTEAVKVCSRLAGWAA